MVSSGCPARNRSGFSVRRQTRASCLTQLRSNRSNKDVFVRSLKLALADPGLLFVQGTDGRQGGRCRFRLRVLGYLELASGVRPALGVDDAGTALGCS